MIPFLLAVALSVPVHHPPPVSTTTTCSPTTTHESQTTMDYHHIIDGLLLSAIDDLNAVERADLHLDSARDHIYEALELLHT